MRSIADAWDLLLLLLNRVDLHFALPVTNLKWTNHRVAWSHVIAAFSHNRKGSGIFAKWYPGKYRRNIHHPYITPSTHPSWDNLSSSLDRILLNISSRCTL